MSGYTGTDNLDIMSAAKNYNNYLLEMVLSSSGPDDVVLDYGAGIGTFAKQLLLERPKVICVEPDINQALAIKDKNIPVCFSIDDVDDESIDCIYSLNVLEHIEDDSIAVSMLFRKLKNDGRLFIYVPAFQILFSSMDEKVGHYRRYTAGGLKKLMLNEGFVIEKIGYADSAGFFVTLLYKVFGSNDGSINPNSLVIYDKFIFPISRLADSVLGYFFGKNVYVIAKKPVK